jgi:hypothetical protein
MFTSSGVKPFQALIESVQLKEGSLFILWSKKNRVSILQRRRGDRVELHHIFKWRQFLLFGPARFRIKTHFFDHPKKSGGVGGDAADSKSNIVLKESEGCRRYFSYDGRWTFERLTSKDTCESSGETKHDYKRVKYVQELMEKIKDRVSLFYYLSFSNTPPTLPFFVTY